MIKSWRVRSEGNIARMEAIRNAYRILVPKTEGKMPLERHRSEWEDNLRMNLEKIVWEVVDSIYMVQDGNQWRAVVNTLMNLRFHKRLRIS
jgi:hypothetical protein